ncbi:MAG: hypothetical protein NT169_16405 [Chloroflexi bacterium]|nr:hypothetical protein [Chloroflexota bacterium]
MTIIARRVTQRGVLVPRALIRAWGNIQEVEIEQRPDAVVIKPKAAHAGDLRGQVVSKMEAAGLIEKLPWPQPPRVSAEVRARLAEKLSRGKPLSEIVLEDR